MFAPIDRAFPELELDKLTGDRNLAKAFVLKHTLPGALYSAGMKYYQVRSTMDEARQVTVYNEAGEFWIVFSWLDLIFQLGTTIYHLLSSDVRVVSFPMQISDFKSPSAMQLVSSK